MTSSTSLFDRPVEVNKINGYTLYMRWHIFECPYVNPIRSDAEKRAISGPRRDDLNFRLRSYITFLSRLLKIALYHFCMFERQPAIA